MYVLAVTNMYPTQADPTHGTFIEQQIKGLRETGVEVDVLHVARGSGAVGSYEKVGPMVREHVARRRPDIVHVMYGGVMADRATRDVGDIPTMVSFCGSDLLGQQLAGTVRRLVAGYGVLCSRRAARRVSGIVVKSRNLQDALPKQIPRSKTRIIPNGIDVNRFQPMEARACRERLGWRTDGFHVLAAANAGGDPRKRSWMATAAVDAARSQGLDVELHLLHGVPHGDVPLWLNACDVVILTSLHEGSPNIIKEALACNVAVVSVDVGDVAERIEGIAGCHIAAADTSDLAAKLCMVHANPERVQSRPRLMELSLERVAHRLSSYYEEILRTAPSA